MASFRRYEDDEKDLVTLVSDDDLQEAIRVLNSMNLASPLRLSVFNSAVAVKAETAVPPTASCLGMAGPSAPWSQASGSCHFCMILASWKVNANCMARASSIISIAVKLSFVCIITRLQAC